MPAPSHLVILVHGINTRALWMSEVGPALENAGFAVAHTSFGRLSVPRFLSPLQSSRKHAIDRVESDIRTAREVHKDNIGSYPEKMSVISHSFGTYVVANILMKAPDLKWERIIFCGSVVREDFPLQQVHTRFRSPLLNEIGSKDYLPALAEATGWGYGSVGSTGFNRPPVETRWHAGYRHSDFLTEKFCTDFWIPFLKGDKPKAADKPTPMPLWVRMITALPLRWTMLAVLVGALGWLAFSVEEYYFGIHQEVVIEPPMPELQTIAGKWIGPSGEVLFVSRTGYSFSGMLNTLGSIRFINTTKSGDNSFVETTDPRCYYSVYSQIDSGEMDWHLKAPKPEPGDKTCPRSFRFKREG